MEKAIKIGIISFSILLTVKTGFPQNKAFDKAIYKGQFSKVEHIIKREVRQHKRGHEFYNGAGSGTQVSFNASYDTLINWLLQHKNIKDATWDKCQHKISIYPGHSSIGVIFKTKNGLEEKCFIIQEGTTGQPNIFGWKPKLFKSKMTLKYKRMRDCKGFVEDQKTKCKLGK